MSKSEKLIVVVIALVLAIVFLGVLGAVDALAAELSPTPTRTLRPTLEPTSTPWPYTPTPYPGPPVEACAVDLLSFSAASVPPGTVYLIAVVVLIAGLIVFFERRYWGK